MVGRLSVFWLATVLAAAGQTPDAPAEAKQIYSPPNTELRSPQDYVPATLHDRLNWFVWATTGPESLLGGLVSAGWGTLLNEPKEYGTHWEGFGKRYGIRLTGVSTSNAMEVGLGALWGEDPRYFRASELPFKGRIWHVLKYTFVATNRNGDPMPAYGRYIAITGSNFLSNTWREPSEATVDHAVIRTALGFLGRMSGNAFVEFWPDVKERIFRRGAEKQP